MILNSLLRLWIVLASLLIVVSFAENGNAAGSPNTRLIALGINYNVAAPHTPAQLFEVDKQSGDITPIGSQFFVEGDHLGANLAGNSLDQLYNVLGGYSNARVNRLTLSGDVAHFVPLSDGTTAPPHVFAIAFDSQDRLHGILLNGSLVIDAPPVLARINTSTGLASTIAILGSADYLSMAFDLQDNLYAVARQHGLLRIDPATGQSTIIGGDLMNLPDSQFSKNPIVFDRDGTMFAFSDRLLVVDPMTGNTTSVGSPSFGPIVGLAVVAIPEPGTLTMFGFAALGLACFSRRQRITGR